MFSSVIHSIDIGSCTLIMILLKECLSLIKELLTAGLDNVKFENYTKQSHWIEYPKLLSLIL